MKGIPILLLVIILIAPIVGQENTNQTDINRAKTGLANTAQFNAAHWFDLGMSLYLQQKYGESLQAYEKALELDPLDSRAWNNKGIDLGMMGRSGEAIQAFLTATNIDPSYAEAWYNLGVIFDFEGDYQTAIQAYNKATEADPSYKSAWYRKNADIDRVGISPSSLYLELTGQKPDNGA